MKKAQNSHDHLLHHRPDAGSILGLVRVRRKSTRAKVMRNANECREREGRDGEVERARQVGNALTEIT